MKNENTIKQILELFSVDEKVPTLEEFKKYVNELNQGDKTLLKAWFDFDKMEMKKNPPPIKFERIKNIINGFMNGGALELIDDKDNEIKILEMIKRTFPYLFTKDNFYEMESYLMYHEGYYSMSHTLLEALKMKAKKTDTIGLSLDEKVVLKLGKIRVIKDRFHKCSFQQLLGDNFEKECAILKPFLSITDWSWSRDLNFLFNPEENQNSSLDACAGKTGHSQIEILDMINRLHTLQSPNVKLNPIIENYIEKMLAYYKTTDDYHLSYDSTENTQFLGVSTLKNIRREKEKTNRLPEYYKKRYEVIRKIENIHLEETKSPIFPTSHFKDILVELLSDDIDGEENNIVGTTKIKKLMLYGMESIQMGDIPSLIVPIRTLFNLYQVFLLSDQRDAMNAFLNNCPQTEIDSNDLFSGVIELMELCKINPEILLDNKDRKKKKQEKQISLGS